MKTYHFTLTEMIFVIAIIGLLAAIGLPVLSNTMKTGKRTTCMNNLRQLAAGVQGYSDTYYKGRRYPSWLSHLFDKYIDNEKIFACPMDKNAGKSANLSENRSSDMHDYDKVKSTFDKSTTATADGYQANYNTTIHVSYCYEFCGGKWPWGSADTYKTASSNYYSGISWQEVKFSLLKDGRKKKMALDTRMPMIRCIWHAEGRNGDTLSPMLNVSTTGNVYASKADWAQGVDL